MPKKWLIDRWFKIRATASGTLNAILMSFTLSFGDGTIFDSTESKHPGQALYYIDEQRSPNVDNSVDIRIACDGTRFCFAQNLQAEQLRSGSLPSWHFAMIHDEVRLNVYLNALRSSIRSSMEVLDAGTGSGLLAHLAAQLGAAKVTAIESSEHVNDTAEEIACINGYERIVSCICADVRSVYATDSPDLINGRKPDSLSPELERRADALVLEVFDDGLLGEGCLSILSTAKHRLLQPDAAIIPSCAHVHCIPIRLNLNRFNIMLENTADLHRFLWSPSYLSLNLKDQESWIALASECCTAFRFDFQNMSPEDVQSQETRMEFIASDDGICNAIAFWFTLTGGDDANNTICTSPFIDANTGGATWQQAVQIVPEHAFSRGSIVSVHAFHDTHEVTFELHAGSGAASRESPMYDNETKQRMESLEIALKENAKQCTNDIEYFKATSKAAQAAGAAPYYAGMEAEAASQMLRQYMH